jgi:hypothetical protein
LPQQVVRFTSRIPKEIPILLIGSDLDGSVFSEPTTTVVISLHGAAIVSRHKLSPEQELILRCPDRNSEAVVRIVGQIGSSPGSYAYGLAFVDPNLNFWTLEFPSPAPAEIAAGQLSMVCSSCKTLEKLDRAGLEAGHSAFHKGILSFCKHCGFSTLWKPASGVKGQEPTPPPAAPTPPSPSIPAPPSSSTSPQTPSAYSLPASVPVQASLQTPAMSQDTVYQEPRGAVLTLPPPSASDTPRVNRRKHVRTKVNFSACVRHPDRGDDIVVCEDMSRGGLRFKSKKIYYERSLIEIAAPYTPGQTPIFIPAQIVSALEIPGEKLFRYGIAYLQLPKPRNAF